MPMPVSPNFDPNLVIRRVRQTPAGFSLDQCTGWHSTVDYGSSPRACACRYGTTRSDGTTRHCQALFLERLKKVKLFAELNISFTAKVTLPMGGDFQFSSRLMSSRLDNHAGHGINRVVYVSDNLLPLANPDAAVSSCPVQESQSL